MNIEKNTLKALMLFAGKNDIRSFINGVYIDVDVDGVTRLVTTDGHKMAIIRLGEYDLPASFIISRQQVELVLKEKANMLDLSYDPTTKIVNLGVVKMPALDATYPNWRRVVPEKASGKLSSGKDNYTQVHSYDIDYLADAKKAYKLLGGKSAELPITFNGARPAVIQEYNFLLMVMPMRADFDHAAPRGVKIP